MEGKTEYVHCPICGESKTSDFVKSNDYQIVRCCECGLLFVNPRLIGEETVKHFTEEYIADIKRAEVDFISLRESSLKREAAIIRNLLPKGGRLLDVGCASGAFLSCFFINSLWRVEGIEPSRFAAKYAREKLGLKVHQGFLLEQKFPDASFDVITSLDTFMLHPNPNEDLAEMCRILKPGGILAMEIPGLKFRILKNTGILCRFVYGVSARLNAGVHLYYYSRETLSLLVAKHGFKLIAYFPEQSPIYGTLLVRYLNKCFFGFSSMIYRLTSGKINIAPKEFLIFQKVQE